MKTQLIQLERHDDITVVVDKITWSKADRVLLVWPARGEVLTRPLDLVLVQRACQRMGVPLACVADDPDVLDHAVELGIPVFHSARVAQRLPWRRRRRKKILEPRLLQQRDQMEELRHRVQPQGQAWTRLPAVRLVSFLLGVLAVLGCMLILFPEAQIDLSLVRATQSIDLDVWASPELTTLNLAGGLPAQVLSVVVEGQAAQSTSGSLTLPEKTASGRVRLTNLTDQAVRVPEGTVVQTLREPVIRFQTDQAVTLPAQLGAVLDCPVEAQLPGSQSNVSAGQIQAVVGEMGLKISVTNPDAITNGRDGSSRAASQADWETLRARLLDTLKASAQREFAGKLAPGSRLIPQSLSQGKILSAKQEPGEGVPADQINLTLQVEYQVWSYQAADLDRLGRTALDTNRPGNKMAVAGSFKSENLSEPSLMEGQARWKVRASQDLQQAWAAQPIVQALTGKPPEAAGHNLQALLELREPAQIHVTPAWWPLLPLLPARIQVNVQ